MTCRKLTPAVLLTVASLGVAAVALPSTVTLEAAADNTLYESTTGALSNGAGQHLFVGQNKDGLLRRALVRFDIASAIPSQSIVSAVTLTLHMSRTQAGVGDVTVHRGLADWGEGTSDAGGEEGGGAAATTSDATWIHTFFNATRWAAAGGDYVLAASATKSIADVASYTWASTPGLVADVQAWVDGTAPNYGFILVGNEAVAQSTKRFDSRSEATVANHPRLTVDFTPPAWGACCDASGGCTMLAPSACTGTYQGDATVCGVGGKCGACCDGVACALTIAGSCTSYRGDGSTCSPDPCAAPVLGACCESNGACTEVDAATCTGGFQGNGSKCGAGGTCGACCSAASCVLKVASTCSGSYRGDATVCSPGSCAKTGACCRDSACTDGETRRDCENRGGEYQGDDQACGTSPCDKESRACCFSSGTCTVLNRDLCDSLGGKRLGGDSTCTDNPCAARGACCFGAICAADTIAEDCEIQGGEFAGGIACSPTVCGSTRACCLPGRGCSILDATTCTGQGGTFEPRGLTCTPDPCPDAACDATRIQPIAGLRAVKASAGRDVQLDWRLDAQASGYNTWLVTTKAAIPTANSTGPATSVPGCVGRTSSDCVHPGAVVPAAGTRLFYNVLGACNGTEAAR